MFQLKLMGLKVLYFGWTVPINCGLLYSSAHYITNIAYHSITHWPRTFDPISKCYIVSSNSVPRLNQINDIKMPLVLERSAMNSRQLRYFLKLS